MGERYRIANPRCTHVRKGIVRAGDPHGVYASTQVCDRDECIEDAKQWAYAQTHEQAEHRPDAARVVAEPSLFPGWSP